MAAHMFLFYFGLLSMLTPPVAVASIVAAGIAGSDMWRTGLVGMQLAAVAYLLPFLWAFNPALIGDGTPTAIAMAIFSSAVAAWMLARALQGFSLDPIHGMLWPGALTVAALLIGSSTVWLGRESPWAAAVSIAGAVGLVLLHQRGKAAPPSRLVALDG
jgi:TRAP-type uncharacterized transport system fused permease subunit